MSKLFAKGFSHLYSLLYANENVKSSLLYNKYSATKALGFALLIFYKKEQDERKGEHIVMPYQLNLTNKLGVHIITIFDNVSFV